MNALRAAAGRPDDDRTAFVPAFGMEVTSGEITAIFKKVGCTAIAPLLKEALDEEVIINNLGAIGVAVAAQGVIEARDPYLDDEGKNIFERGAKDHATFVQNVFLRWMRRAVA